MANPLRGETPFTHEGQGYVLLYTLNELAALQARGVKFSKLDEIFGADEPDFGVIIDVFHAGLARRQPDMTKEGAGDLLTSFGLEEGAGLIEAAFTAAFPPPKAAGDQEPGKAKKGRAGTSTRS